MHYPTVVHHRPVRQPHGAPARVFSWVPPASSVHWTQKDTPAIGSAAKPQWASPPREEKFTPAGAAKFVICDDTIETFDQDGKGHLGVNEYRLRSAEAMGKHGCLVVVADSLWHLTCLPAGPDRTKGLIHTIGDACRQQGRALMQRLMMFVHHQLSQGDTVDPVFARLFAKQRGMVPG